MFTLADKVLLDRAARLVMEQAEALENSYGKPAWIGEESRKQKLVFDRHQRDARDLRSLARRMASHFHVAPAPRQLKGGRTVVEAVTALSDTLQQQKPLEVRLVDGPQAPAEPSIAEQRAMGVLGGHGADQQELGIAHG